MSFTSHKNCLVAARPDGSDEQMCIRQFRNRLQIRLRLFRQLLEGLAFVSRRKPAFKLDVNRFARRENFRVVRHVIVLRLAVAIRDADLDVLHRVETVEIGDGEIVNAIDHRGVTCGDGIEPAAAACAAGRRAEFAAHAVEQVGDLLVLRGQRPFADTRGVSLHHADDAVYAMRRHAGTGAGAARRGIR